jgi:NADH dehydrogenase
VIVNSVCVLGGTGFVGRHICQQLAGAGYRVAVPTRNRERAKQDLILLPTVDVFNADVHDPRSLADAVHRCDAVINLIGVLHDGRRRASFREAHVELARKVVTACRENGIRRLLQMSALNADASGPSEYLRSKGEAEAVVRGSGLDYTIFRPSVIFGREDRFLNLFAQLQRAIPLLMLGSAGAQFQPVFVEDVAACFVASVPRLESFGQSYDLAGPTVYTLRELVKYVGELTGHPRPVLGLGPRLSYVQAGLFERLPGKLLTRDNVRSMTRANVSQAVLPFGIAPTPLEAVAPTWLAERTPRQRYFLFRNRSPR